MSPAWKQVGVDGWGFGAWRVWPTMDPDRRGCWKVTDPSGSDHPGVFTSLEKAQGWVEYTHVGQEHASATKAVEDDDDAMQALALRFVVAVERAAAALERLAQDAPEPERCPECDSLELDEIEEGEGLIALQCAGCGHSWFPPEPDEPAEASKKADALQH